MHAVACTQHNNVVLCYSYTSKIKTLKAYYEFASPGITVTFIHSHWRFGDRTVTNPAEIAFDTSIVVAL
jgi:hypothetical protein